VLPRAAGHQPGSARQRGALTDRGNSAAAPQVRVRHTWQQGGDPLIGSNGAVRGMPADAAAGRRAHCNLWSARAHRRHTYATVLPATIDGIHAHFGNPTQITLSRMPVSAGSPHEKTVHNEADIARRISAEPPPFVTQAGAATAPSRTRRRYPAGGHASNGCSARVSSGAQDPSQKSAGESAPFVRNDGRPRPS